MVYLLAGLLIFHGVVCLLGAFFPFYPPVFFFYWFFPDPFIIKLVIVLLAGALQLVYGTYLLIQKRWHLRWYWLTIVAVVTTCLLLIYPAISAPGLFTGQYGGGEIHPTPSIEPPPYPSAIPRVERPDDIMPTPGGLAYRANVHQEGVETDLPHRPLLHGPV